MHFKFLAFTLLGNHDKSVTIFFCLGFHKVFLKNAGFFIYSRFQAKPYSQCAEKQPGLAFMIEKAELKRVINFLQCENKNVPSEFEAHLRA